MAIFGAVAGGVALVWIPNDSDLTDATRATTTSLPPGHIEFEREFESGGIGQPPGERPVDREALPPEVRAVDLANLEDFFVAWAEDDESALATLVEPRALRTLPRLGAGGPFDISMLDVAACDATEGPGKCEVGVYPINNPNSPARLFRIHFDPTSPHIVQLVEAVGHGA